MRTLKPIRDFDSYSKPIARAIFKQLDEMIYGPLLSIIKEAKEIHNARISALESSLHRGIMEYRDGYFVGPLTAAISKELRSYGAVYNKVRKVYYLEIAQMPQNILQAIAAGNQASQSVLKKVQTFLRSIEGREIKAPKIEPLFDEVLDKLGKQFNITTKVVTDRDLEIPINPKFADQIKEAYTDNLDKYIKEWHDQAILRLREKVSENVEAGFRAENLIDIIKLERGVSQRKAIFLAKQETSLMTASYREIRYKDIGVQKYVWSTSHDERVREDHKILNGHVFDFDHPPVTNQKTGAKNNPGEDYGCRCVAIPYVSNRINFYDDEPISTQKLMESINVK